MREAGVAGAPMLPSMLVEAGADWDWACSAGDCTADMGRGGGPMIFSILSDRVSGEIESVLEPSVMWVVWVRGVEPWGEVAWCASRSMFCTSLTGMMEDR